MLSKVKLKTYIRELWVSSRFLYLSICFAMMRNDQAMSRYVQRTRTQNTPWWFKRSRYAGGIRSLEAIPRIAVSQEWCFKSTQKSQNCFQILVPCGPCGPCVNTDVTGQVSFDGFISFYFAHFPACFQDMERIRTLGRELRTIFSPEPVRVVSNHLPRLWPGGCHHRQCVGHLRWEALVRRCPTLGNGWKWAAKMAMEAAKTMRFFEFHPAWIIADSPEGMVSPYFRESLMIVGWP